MKKFNTLSAAIAAVLSPLAAIAGGAGAVITVDTSASGTDAADGACSLAEAVDNANADAATHGNCSAGVAADLITFDAALTGQTISLASGPLQITSNITIDGIGAQGLTLSGANTSSIFDAQEGSTLALSNLELREGYSTTGPGALYSRRATINIDRVVFASNVGAMGGAVEITGSPVGSTSTSIRDSLFIGNRSTNWGGAIRASDPLNVQRTSFVDNHADDRGGAIHVDGRSAVLIDSTLSFNSTDSNGGAIYVGAYSTFTARHTTFAGNSAGGQGDAIFGQAYNSWDLYSPGGSAAQITIRNSVVSGSGGACSLQTAGPYTATLTGTGNHFEDASCDGPADGDPGLAPTRSLDAYGKPFHGLVIDSPLIDAGDATRCTGTDQRMLIRPPGACDIGAIENQDATAQSGAAVVVNAFGDAGDGFCGDQVGQCTLRDALLAAESDPDASTINFDAAVFSAGDTLSLTQGELTVTTDVTLAGSELVVERDPAGGACVLDATVEDHEFRLIDVSNSSLTLSDLTLQGGCADRSTGGALQASDATLTLTRVTLTGNSALIDGGGLYANAETSAATVIDASAFENNFAAGYGGGVKLRTATPPSISASRFLGNTASTGGGLDATGDIDLADLTVSGNRAYDDAGGLKLAPNTSATLTRSTFDSNVSDRNGGALMISSATATTTISRSTFSNNSATQVGAGIRQINGTLSLENSTLSGNTAEFGGALVSYGTTDISDSTFYGNTAANLAEIVGSDSVSLLRTVIAATSESACSSTMSASDSIATELDCSGNTASLAALALGPLADNGGTTQTHLPLLGSVLIDAASGCGATDQRGLTRPIDADGDGGALNCDIGAVELQNTPPSAVLDEATADQDSGTSGNVLSNDSDADDEDAGTLRVTAVDGVPGDVGVQTPLLGGGALTLQSDGSFTFDPLTDFVALAAGESRLTGADYTISDGLAEATGTLEITVNGLNDAPTAGAVSDLTTEGGFETVGFAGADPDTSDTLTYTIATGPSEGRIVNNGDGSFDFFTDADFEDLDDGESRAASATYVVSDGTATSDPADITMTVQGVNDAPVAGADNYTVEAGQTLAVNAATGLLSNDSDIDGDAITLTTTGIFTAGGVGGELDIAADGSFAFTAPESLGTATFTYTVTDGDASDTGELTIEVSDPPTTADLQIDKTDGVEIIPPDHVFNYRISVFNAGPADAVGAAVQDVLPAELANVSWSCEAIGAAACGSASGTGDIQELVDIPSGDAVIFELTATVTGATMPIVNTATVAAPVDLVDEDQSNNSATDTDLPVLVYRDGFESPAVRSQSFAVRHATLAAESLVVPADGPPTLVLRAQDSGQAELALALVHARRVEGRIELRISRLEHGQWALGEWRPMTDTSVELRW